MSAAASSPIPESSAQIKLDICKSCPYKKDNNLFGVHFITCGKFMTGELVQHNGKTVQLCGCVMELKTFLSDAVKSLKCPAERW